MPDPQQGYLGSQFPVPTDPSYYLGQVGLSALSPQAFNANTLSAMFSPQGMQFTPANAMATNPFLSMFMQDAQNATKMQRKSAPNGMQQPGQDQQQGQIGQQPY